MQLRIVGSDLPGLACGPSRNFPGYENIHVGVQRRNRPGELLGLVGGDAASARWELDCDVVDTAAGVDVKGPYVQGRPNARFVYLSWGTVDADGVFTLFRRAKLWLDGVAPEVMGAARRSGTLVGRLGLRDGCGNPVCASVRPPRIEWSAG